MASECRRNRELARQTRARVEGEGHVPYYSTPERGNGDDSTPTSVANSARERARERRETEEGQHRQALLQAAAQARLDRKLVQQKMQELDRANSNGTCNAGLAEGAVNSLDAVFSAKQHAPSTKEELRLHREFHIEEPRRAPPAPQREVRALRAQASPGLFGDSPAADGSSRADLSDGGGAAASAVAAVASAAAAAAEASFRHCLIGRFNTVAEDGHGGVYVQPSPSANTAAGPRTELRRDSKRGPKSSIGLVGGMVASVSSRPVTADVKDQASEEIYGAAKADLLGPTSHVSLEDRLVDELTRCGASPPNWKTGLTTADLVEWSGARPQSPVDDVIDDDVDAMSDSWHAAKEVTEQAAATLEYSLTMPLASPQAAL